MRLILYPAIRRKLAEKHGVTMAEVQEAFRNRRGKLAKELRPLNRGEYPRYWFIAETSSGRRLKVVFVRDPDEPWPVVITAYEPNEAEEGLYVALQEDEGRGPAQGG